MENRSALRARCLLPAKRPEAHSGRDRGERGQTIVFVLLALSVFLLAAVGFTVDIANLWFHRQMAQNAADAACTGGAMDMFVLAQGGTLPGAHFTPGTNFDCGATTPNTATTAPTPCWYAAVNGYTSPSSFSSLVAGQPSNNVYASFPTSISGFTAPPNGMTPCTSSGCPYLRIDIVDRVKVFFIGLLTASRTVDVRAFSECGLQVDKAPIPIVVLNPTVSGSLYVGGNSSITVAGGSTMGIEVNSNSTSAITGGGTVDLCYGGRTFCGSNLGVFGAVSATSGFITSCPPATPPPNAPTCTGTQNTPQWISPATPTSDPFAQVAAPSPAGMTARTGPGTAAYLVNGCPDPNGCDEYAPGTYASGLCVKNGGQCGNHATAIFDPGVYYVTGGMSVDSGSCVRPSIGGALPDSNSVDQTTIGGSMFYFADTNSVTIAANSGKFCPTSFNAAANEPCPGATYPSWLPTMISGNVLLAPCTGPYGDLLGTSDPAGEQRGILLFQNRSQFANGSLTTGPNLSGGGQILIAGAMYFHQCTTGGSDTGVGCSSSAFNTIFTYNGNPGSSTFVLGNIVADQISLKGSSTLLMNLNPNAAFQVLKVSLLR